jgi:membrane protein involved in colicin uptake
MKLPDLNRYWASYTLLLPFAPIFYLVNLLKLVHEKQKQAEEQARLDALKAQRQREQEANDKREAELRAIEIAKRPTREQIRAARIKRAEAILAAKKEQLKNPLLSEQAKRRINNEAERDYRRTLNEIYND